MAQFRGISVYASTFDKISIVASLTHKEKCDLFYELFNEIEEALKRSVQNEGKLIFNWQMMTKLSGNKLEIMFLPKIKVIHESVDMDSKAPTTEEIAQKTGVEP